MNLLNRLSDAWAAFMGRPTSQVRDLTDEMVSINRELAETRLELADARRALNLCRRRIEDAEANAGHSSADPLENLFLDLASFLSQLKMLAALMDSGSEIIGNSVMALVRQLIDAVEKAGMEPIAACGKEIPFDPRACEAMAADISFLPEEPVVVRFVGYRYKGRIIRKALVERNN
jgi:molecular chaperone GrpE (heat shock protein)